MNDASPTPPFAMVPLPEARSTKPRTSGLTMMMDWGLSRGQAEDYLSVIGNYVDLVKFVVGTARLYPESYLRDKLALYGEHNVEPFIGGQFAEYVFATQGWDAMPGFFEEAKRLGFGAVEVSDNCVPLDDEARRRMIETAVGCGLHVHGEVGSKMELQDADDIIRQAEICFDAGCEVVLVEAAELMVDGNPNRDLIDAVRTRLDMKKVIFELDGPWIAGVTATSTYALKKFLIAEFGPDVNLANVMPGDVMETEAHRVGLSVIGPKLG